MAKARDNKAGARDAGTRTRTIGFAAEQRSRVRPKGGSRYGLVIGVGKHSNEKYNLEYAHADAQAMYDLMTDKDCGMFPKRNVQLLLDEKANWSALRKEFARLIRSTGANDVVWVYYAGHACREGSDIYWLQHDASLEDLYGTAMSGSDVNEAFTKIRADRLIMFLDCCYAEAVTEDGIAGRTAEAALSADEITRKYSGEGRMTIAASRNMERAVEDKSLGHGVFTYYLIEGLSGEADDDADGVVTASELLEYLPERVREASKRLGCEHVPVLSGRIAGEVALTLNKRQMQTKNEIQRKLDELTGFRRDDKLTNVEAEFCMGILERGARTQAEQLVEDEFAGLMNGTTSPERLRLVVQVAMRDSSRTPPTPVPGRVSVVPGVPKPPTIVTAPHKTVIEDGMVRVEPVDVPAFYICRYPVTNREYAEFLRNAASRQHTHCHEDEPPHKDHRPLGWSADRVRYSGNHPVSGVDWYDAYAYASWRGWRLPSVQEWELAAGYDPDSATSRRFPWGEDPERAVTCCNCWEASKPDGYENTTPVGAFPDGISPWGCHDMAGNVWEWCVSARGKLRILKGGSYHKRHGYCPHELQVEHSYSQDPEKREEDYGFRCCR